MYLEIEFEEQDNSFDLEFEQVTEISDGGYDRGYAEGYENGKGDGLTEGYAKGETEGFADALAKREELVVTENGEYTPSDGSTGFKKVTANIQTVDLNIAYGETEPSDTSKLWVKTSEPSKVIAAFGLQTQGFTGTEDIEQLPVTLARASSNVGAAAVEKTVYLFGGNISGWGLTTIYRFDTETHGLTELGATLPYIFAHRHCIPIGTKIYIFGNSAVQSKDYHTSILCFDTITETISTLSTSFPTGATGSVAAAVSSRIYRFGGENAKGYLNTIYRFDTETEKMTTLSATLPNKMTVGCGCSCGTKIYLFGGWTGSAQNIVQCFDAETETLTTVATTAGSCSGSTCAVYELGEKIYLFNGSGYAESVACFNCNTLAFETVSVTLPSCYYMGATSVGNEIYLFGGTVGGVYQDTIFRFTAKGVYLEKGDLAIIQARNDNIFPIVNTEKLHIEISVDSVFKGNADNIAEEIETALYKDGAWTNI